MGIVYNNISLPFFSFVLKLNFNAITRINTIKIFLTDKWKLVVLI